VPPASIIALMMEASASETSAKSYQSTRRNNTGDSHIYKPRFKTSLTLK
jgi:hypothetical protein